MAVFENFMEDVTIIAVQRFFTIKNCLLCGEEVDIDGEHAKCTQCHPVQLTAKCRVSYSARIMLQDLTGVKKMTWVHYEHIITICGTEKDITPNRPFRFIQRYAHKVT